MKLKSLLLASLLACTFGAVHAENLAPPPIAMDQDGLDFSVGFPVTHLWAGTFVDTFVFTPPVGPSEIDGQLVTITLAPENTIYLTGATVTGSLGGSSGFLPFVGGAFILPGGNSLSGTLTLQVMGCAMFCGSNVDQVAANATYTGSLNVTAAVPEPETYGMLLGGLGLLGFAARRKQN
ncbi:MAG: FxDxF family PEP-CTERM protein [Pseudomonadota bacterium]